MAMSSLAALSSSQADAVVSQHPSPFSSQDVVSEASEPLTRAASQQSLSARANRKRRAAAQLTRIDLSASTAFSGSNESLNSAGGAGSDSDDGASSQGDTPGVDADFEKRSRFVSTSSSQSSTSSGPEDCYDLADIECSQGSTSAKSCPIASGGLVIGQGEYELVGDGRGCKAVHVSTQTIYQCQVMKADEYRTFMEIAYRVEKARAFYAPDEYDEIKQLILPDGLRVVAGEHPTAGTWYLLMPDHHGNLHTHVQPLSQNITVFSERRTQQIFGQVVRLVELCHRCGLFFRDLRLGKIVFSDLETNKIRLNNVLDLYVMEDIDNDSTNNRVCVCPAYMAPEVFPSSRSTRSEYSARCADIWALGVFLFVLLKGHYPFYDANPTLLFRRIRCRKFTHPVPDRLSSEVKWLVYGILRSNPLERPTVSEIINSHWLQKDPTTLSDVEYTSSVLPDLPPAAPRPPPAAATGASPRTTLPPVTVPPTPQPSAPAFVRFLSFPAQLMQYQQQQQNGARVQPRSAAVSRLPRSASVNMSQATLAGLAAHALQRPSLKPAKPEDDQLVPNLGADFQHTEEPTASAANRTAAPRHEAVAGPVPAAGPHSRL